MNKSEHLNTDNNFNDPDAFYAALIDCHRELEREESERFNARLILILANQIGDTKLLREALAAAQSNSHSERDHD